MLRLDRPLPNWGSKGAPRHSAHHHQERERSLFHVETLLENLCNDQNCAEPLNVAGLGDELPISTSHVDVISQETVFPVILLTGKQIALKIGRLQSLLSNWNALTNLFDQSGSGHGNIKVSDLRCALMAMADVDGALVGGASLDAAAFAKIAGFTERTGWWRTKRLLKKLRR